MLIHTFESDNFDSMFRDLISKLVFYGDKVEPRAQATRELLNVNLVLTEPRNRFLYSKVRRHSYAFAGAELLWYLSGSNQLAPLTFYSPPMGQHSDDGKTLRSAYGYRIFGTGTELVNKWNQWENVKKKLIEDQNSRRGIMFICMPIDVEIDTVDVPCTAFWHFFIRNKRLNLITTMRSNDAFRGLIYDLFASTALLELMQYELSLEGINVRLGHYMHRADSMHIYERDVDLAIKVLGELKMNRTHDGLKLDGKTIKALIKDEEDLRTKKMLINDHLYKGLNQFLAKRLNNVCKKKWA